MGTYTGNASTDEYVLRNGTLLKISEKTRIVLR